MSDSQSHEEEFLAEALALVERWRPGLGATIERELVRDRNREADRPSVRPSNVSAADWVNSNRVSLERARSRFIDQVNALIAAEAAAIQGHLKPESPTFDPIMQVRTGATLARELTRAEEAVPREAAWEAVTSRVESLYREFCDTPPIPRLPKNLAELAWRSAALGAGIAGGDRRRIRELREDIKDEGGTVE